MLYIFPLSREDEKSDRTREKVEEKETERGWKWRGVNEIYPINKKLMNREDEGIWVDQGQFNIKFFSLWKN